MKCNEIKDNNFNNNNAGIKWEMYDESKENKI